MPGNTHKSAAVPFVNQKGERSMKKVKVERYVAGKKPAYAKDHDEEEEYYITDDEDDYDEAEDEEQEENDDDEAHRAFRSNRNLDYGKHDSDDDDESSASDSKDHQRPGPSGIASSKGDNQHDKHQSETDDDDDDDDPRFRQLKQIKSKASGAQLIEIQRTMQIQPKQELKNVVIDEDDDENEIRRRHAQARLRQVEVAAEQSRVLSGPSDIKQEGEDDDEYQDGSNRPSKRLETDDLLKDLKLSGITRPMRAKLKTDEEEREDKRRMRELIEQAKLEASFTRKTYEKIDEDIKKEVEREALAKGDIGAREMTSVNTDDEDDEIAYEEWKLREIQRVLRDRSERRLASYVR